MDKLLFYDESVNDNLKLVGCFSIPEVLFEDRLFYNNYVRKDFFEFSFDDMLEKFRDSAFSIRNSSSRFTEDFSERVNRLRERLLFKEKEISEKSKDMQRHEQNLKKNVLSTKMLGILKKYKTVHQSLVSASGDPYDYAKDIKTDMLTDAENIEILIEKYDSKPEKKNIQSTIDTYKTKIIHLEEEKNKIIADIEAMYDNDIRHSYLHWMIETMRKIGDSIDFRVIDFSKLESKQSSYYNYLVYNKLPERLIYGILKHSNNCVESSNKIFLDSNNMYIRFDVCSYLTNHLNALAIYRGLNYKVAKSEIILKKKVEGENPSKYVMGISIVDMILSIVRHVIIHNQYIASNKSSSSSGQTTVNIETKDKLEYKFKFIDEMLESFESLEFLKNSTIFHCTGSEKMKRATFMEELNNYMDIRGLR